jgi:serine/threonine protein kinase
MTLNPGQVIGNRCEIIRLLGGGNFGATYLAKDLHSMGDLCAVKQFIFTCNTPTILQKAKDLFEREATVLKQLTNIAGNSYIPKFIAYFEENQEFYLLQEFIEGYDLREELQQRFKLKEGEVIHLLKEVLMSLSFLHNKGFIHRDIKPDNLMKRTSDNSIVLIDFGAVKQIVTQLTSPETTIYTPGYAPPEQHHGFTTESSDIYALGITAIEALSGLRPHKMKDLHTGRVIWPSQLKVSEKLVNILEKMVDNNYRKGRYKSAMSVLQDLQELSNTHKVVRFSQNRLSGSIEISKKILLATLLLSSVPAFILYKWSGTNNLPNNIQSDMKDPPSSIDRPTPTPTPTPSCTNVPFIKPGSIRCNK